MSKAFTKEDDDAPTPPVIRRGVPVPEPNFVTPAGLRAARAELDDPATDEGRRRELAEHLATAQARRIASSARSRPMRSAAS